MTEPTHAASFNGVNARPFTERSRGFMRLALGVVALLLAVGAYLAGPTTPNG